MGEPPVGMGTENPATPDSRYERSVRRVPESVLLVEDNRDSAELMALILREFGYTVHVCYEGKSAIEDARTFQPDMVILDIGLPDMSGYEVAEQLRSIPGLQDVGLVALTGYGQSDYQQRAINAGFDAHVVKPVDVQTLSEVIQRVYRGRS